MRLSKRLAPVILLITTITASSSFAVGPGFYIGLMTGPATNTADDAIVYTAPTDPPTMPQQALTRPKSKQWGSRIYMGYQMGRYAGVEAGLVYFSTISYDTVGNVQTACSDAKVRVRNFDVVGKGIFPFGDAFDIFGKAGVAITYFTTSGAFNQMLDNQGNVECGKSNNKVKYVPTFSVGASYAFTQSWVADFSYNAILVGGVPGRVSYMALGISWHNVDVYCGQFLCDD